MYNNKKYIVICDLESTQDDETGDRVISIQNGRKIIAQKDFVGVTTQTLAQMQNMVFDYSITVDRMFYNEQKYLYMDSKLYKIQTVAPAKLNKDCKLNVVKFHDVDIENAIEEWLENDI